jgi:inhibitor of cysteine peptidase
MNRFARPVVRAAGAALAISALASCATLTREGVVAGQDGGSVVVRQGTPLVISLEAVPTTGYGWTLTSDPGATLWLINGPDWTSDPKPEGLMGVAGTTTYRFRATQAGTTTLEFAYRRAWDDGIAPVKVVRYDVTVRKATFFDLF